MPTSNDAEDTRMFMSRQFAKERDELKAEIERLRAAVVSVTKTGLDRCNKLQAEVEIYKERSIKLEMALREITELADLYHPSQRIARANLAGGEE